MRSGMATLMAVRGRGGVRDAEDSLQRFEDDENVEGPEKEAHNGDDQHQESLGGGVAESIGHQDDGGDQSGQKMQAINEGQAARRHVFAKREVEERFK